jgi:hypothetical protein
MKAIRQHVPMGRRQPAPQEYGAKDFFTYSMELPTGLANGLTNSATFTIDNDSDFLWQKSTYFVNVGDAGFNEDSRPIPGVTLVIKDTTSGREMSTTQVPISAMFGTGELPFILPVPKLLARVTTISVTFANITDDTDYSFIGLYFHGQKLFG